MRAERTMRNTRKTLIGLLLILAVFFSSVAIFPGQADASPRTVKQAIKPIGNGKGCKLWVQDTISYKVENGKIVSKPTVSSKTSAANKLLGYSVKMHYYPVKSPTISYTKGNRTATVKTYWGVKQALSIWKFTITYGKTCTVTYTLNGNGKITYTKKASGLKFFD